MTRAQIVTLARDYLQEAGTVPLSSALANDLVNEAQGELAEVAEYSFASFTVTGGLVENQHDYALPNTLVRARAVAVQDADGNLRTLREEQTERGMDAAYPSWRTDAAGLPDRWWPAPNAVWLHPKPSATYAATPLQIRGSRTPPDMTGDSDVPVDLPARYHRTLAKYVAWRWLEIDKESPAAQKWAGVWKSEFDRDVARLRALVRSRFDTDGPSIRLDPGRPVPDGWLDDEV